MYRANALAKNPDFIKWEVPFTEKQVNQLIQLKKK